MKYMKRCLMFAASALLSLNMLITASAAQAQTEDTMPFKLVMDSEYVSGKVNDPVSKKAKSAFIVRDNAEFHIEAMPGSSLSSAAVVFYENEYKEDQDEGVINRIQMKIMDEGESSTMLPDDVFIERMEAGVECSLMESCYRIRVYMDEAQTEYKDYYFGLVDDLTYERKYEEMIQQQEEAARKAAELKNPLN